MDLRRQDRKTTANEAVELLRDGEYGVLSICGKNNQGYGIPMNYAYENNVIYFHCASVGTKLDYIRYNDKVSFCVIGNTKVIPEEFGTLYGSVIATGQITEAAEDEKTQGLRLLVKKYSPGFIKEGENYIKLHFERVKVLKLQVDSITGKARKR